MAKRARKALQAEGRGVGQPVYPLSPYSVQVNYAASQGIVQGTGADWFGPLNPLAPVAPAEVAGRTWDYITGFNLQVTPRANEVVGFPLLRTLADSYDLLRLVIETRKDQMCRLRWAIRPRGEKGATTKKRGKAAETPPEQQSKIDTITSFFNRPDRANRWRPWLRLILEDLYVIDAPSLYCQRTRGGDLYALHPLDGGTIKVVIDDWGRTPQPHKEGAKLIYPPAYQQNLKGFPAVNYTTRDLVYRPNNRRSNKAYGYSPVEQIILTVNIALRRQMFQLAYYTEGNVPESLIGTPDNWTPDQILAFQNNWDAMLNGNLAARRRAKFVPGGVAKTYIATKEPDLKNPMDEWLARVVCFAFSISPQGFVAQMNRATSDTAREVAEEEGIEPTKEWVKEVIDDLLEAEFAAPDLEFCWDEETAVDPKVQADVLTEKVGNGLLTINQALEDMGEQPSDNPAADRLMVKTATGFVPIEANTIEGKKEAMDELGPPPPPPGTPGAAGGPGAAQPGAGGGKAPPPKGGKGEGASNAPSKLAKAAPGGRRLTPIPFNRKAVRIARAATEAHVLAAFATAKAEAVRAARTGLARKAKTPKQKADEIADSVDLSSLTDLVTQVGDDLSGMAVDSATRALAQLGVDKEADLVEQVSEMAVKVARNIGAELVGMRYNSDGELVEAARAEYRIDQSTRDMIRELIAGGLEDNLSTDEIADSIQDATAFSDERAALIANTEVRRANSYAALEGYKAGADAAGLVVQKEWMITGGACVICEENADQGPIDLEEEFESGDDAPPAHPNCRCAIAPVVQDDEGNSSDDDE